jgi:alkylation response protein AidB-like acyl-CoA dehydrogenase
MKFALTEEQDALRDMARRFLADHSSSEQVRAAMETDLGWSPDVWTQLSQDLGWTALTIPEQYGGFGFSATDLVPLMEEMGRSLLCSPFFSSICLGANALLMAGSETQQAEFLPNIASGETLATLALTEPGGGWDLNHVKARCRRDGDDWILSGTKRLVPDAHAAHLFFVVAREDETAGDSGLRIFAVSRDTKGLTASPLATMDRTRRLGSVALDDVRVPADAELAAEGVGAGPAVRRVLDLAGAALASEQVGGAEACLDLAVDYAKVREQFGRAIGSFQAIKHKCADMLLQVESARSAAWYAGWVAGRGDWDELAQATATAQAYCSDAYFHCAAESIQIHGGIGFTWEHDAHLYYRRAKSSESLLGDGPHHRARFALPRS